LNPLALVGKIGAFYQIKLIVHRKLNANCVQHQHGHMAARLAENNPPMLTMVWLMTLAEVTDNPLGAVWIQPKDYRDITSGTPFEAQRKIRAFGYRRQPEREIFLESKVRTTSPTAVKSAPKHRELSRF
jgi:hypothetical protein